MKILNNYLYLLTGRILVTKVKLKKDFSVDYITNILISIVQKIHIIFMYTITRKSISYTSFFKTRLDILLWLSRFILCPYRVHLCTYNIVYVMFSYDRDLW